MGYPVAKTSCEEMTMLLIQPGFGLSIKKGHMFGEKESQRKMVSIRLPYLDNKDARLYHLEGVIRTQAILLKEGKIKS